MSLELKCFSNADLPILDRKNVSSSTGSNFSSPPPSLYHLNAQLAFSMCGKCGGICQCFLEQKSLLSEMQFEGAGTRGMNVPALDHTRRVQSCISDLQNTSDVHPDRPGPVEPAFT